MKRFYPEHIFPYLVKVVSSTEGLLLRNYAELQNFLSTDMFDTMLIKDVEINAFAHLNQVSIQMISVNDDALSTHFYNSKDDQMIINILCSKEHFSTILQPYEFHLNFQPNETMMKIIRSNEKYDDSSGDDQDDHDGYGWNDQDGQDDHDGYGWMDQDDQNDQDDQDDYDDPDGYGWNDQDD